MRRYLVAILALGLLIPFGACGGTPSQSPTVTSTTQPASQSARTSPVTSQATVASTATATSVTAAASATPASALQSAAPTAASAVSPVASPTAQTKINVLDVHTLPLGDGKVSTSPQVGYVYSCQTQFKVGGAQHTGSWIHGDTWDLTEKVAVEGQVTWPDAQFQLTTDGNQRVITGNGLPVDSVTGIFPIQKSDPAYQVDTNPNSIKTQTVSFSLPLNPMAAASPSCVPMGMIGVALNGVAIFNALDASGRDAVAHETQDVCDGHPQSQGIYHYHGPSPCMPGASGNNQLVGYALDGYGIYSMYDANGKEITNADLDACHGTTSEVMWNGKMVNMYHYVLTQEYPYTIGCFMGSPMRVRAEATNQSIASVSSGTGVEPSLLADKPQVNRAA